MQKRQWTGAGVLLFLATCAGWPQQSRTFDTAVLPILRNSCEPCHNSIEGSGGLNIKEFETEDTLVSRRDVWDRILRRVRNGEMPPRRVAKPAGIPDMVAYLEQAFDHADKNAATGKQP